MTDELTVAIEEFCDSIANFIDIVYSGDPKFIRHEGRLVLEDKPVPCIKKDAKKMACYEKLHALIADDEDFRFAHKKAGSWGKPDGIIEEMVKRAFNDGKIDSSPAITYIQNFSKTLSMKYLDYTIFRRILGIEMTCDRIELEPGVVLVRLTEKEMNDRMPNMSMMEIGMPYIDLTQHMAELRCTVQVKNKKLYWLNPSKDIKDNLLNMCNIVFSSLILYKSGMMEAGPYFFKINPEGGEDLFEHIPLTYQFFLPVFPGKIFINEEDIEPLQSSYRAVNKICSETSVLYSALKRFILGTNRVIPEDKLVDYVVAWESLLLTVDDKPVKGELSYRFGLNGSSILHWACPEISREEAFEFMRALYECRSIIVHGAGNQKNLEKALVKGQAEDLFSMANRGGEYLKRVIFWMADIEEEKRPYKTRGGWENLLWNNP